LEPHELEALGTATDLRCHSFPRTLSFRQGVDAIHREPTLVQDARLPQDCRYLFRTEGAGSFAAPEAVSPSALGEGSYAGGGQRNAAPYRCGIMRLGW